MSKDKLVETLKAIAHPLRFEIVKALRRGEINVGEIEEATAIKQPMLSQQLAVLRKAGLVETRKDAKLVFYKVASERFDELAQALAALGSGASPAPARKRAATAGAANFARLA